jgi:hypothetical protein
MPLFAGLFVKMLSAVYGLMAAMFGAAWAVRITAAVALAGLYVACAITFSIMIVPWFSGLIATKFGILLGLLFPPAAGTVLASLGTFWACILAKRYSVKLIKMTAGGGAAGPLQITG